MVRPAAETVELWTVTMFGFSTVYLARHGQTEWNLAGRRQGRLDSPLTALGREQAHAGAKLLADTVHAAGDGLGAGTGSAGSGGIDTIAASPLGRARTTADVYAAALNLPVAVYQDLAEVDHGAVSGLTNAEIEAAYPDFKAKRAQDKYGLCFPGGESYADADARAARVLAAIAASGARRPLIVAHEMIGRMLLRNLAGLSPEQALATHQPWDVIYRVAPGSAPRVDRLEARGADELVPQATVLVPQAAVLVQQTEEDQK